MNTPLLDIDILYLKRNLKTVIRCLKKCTTPMQGRKQLVEMLEENRRKQGLKDAPEIQIPQLAERFDRVWNATNGRRNKQTMKRIYKEVAIMLHESLSSLPFREINSAVLWVYIGFFAMHPLCLYNNENAKLSTLARKFALHADGKEHGYGAMLRNSLPALCFMAAKDTEEYLKWAFPEKNISSAELRKHLLLTECITWMRLRFEAIFFKYPAPRRAMLKMLTEDYLHEGRLPSYSRHVPAFLKEISRVYCGILLPAMDEETICRKFREYWAKVV